jgi:hypothetical protein
MTKVLNLFCLNKVLIQNKAKEKKNLNKLKIHCFYYYKSISFKLFKDLLISMPFVRHIEENAFNNDLTELRDFTY